MYNCLLMFKKWCDYDRGVPMDEQLEKDEQLFAYKSKQWKW